jgi:hypothetical protein
LKNIAAESQCVCSKKDDEEWVDPNLSRRGSYTKSSSVKIEKGCTTTKTLDSPTHSKVSSISNEIDSDDLSRRGDNNVLESDEGEAPSRPIKNVEKTKRAGSSPYIVFCQETRPTLAAAHPNLGFIALNKMLAQMWSELDEPAKLVNGFNSLQFIVLFIFFFYISIRSMIGKS